MTQIIRRCEYCHKSIDHRGVKAKTCSNTCKQYAMQVRKGERDPIPLLEDVEEVGEELSKDDLENQLKDLEEKLRLSDLKLNTLKDEYSIEYDEVQDLILKNFRLRESRNDFLKKHFYNTDEIAGSDLLGYSNIITRYPFKDLDHILFCKMGEPIQPFLTVINGAKDTGKTILSVLISIELTDVLNAKVLHVLDFENKDKAIEYYSILKANSDKLVLKPVETFNEIHQSLTKDDYEFLIIDSIDAIQGNYTQLKQLKKSYPKLSVFCVLGKQNKSILESADILFKTEIFNNHFDTNGASANIYTNGVSREDQYCSIFISNQFNEFTISL